MAVKLIIDSASDINKTEADQLGIIMIPMTITFGEEDYLDGVNLLPNQFYEKLVESDTLPKTSQVNSFRFDEEFKKVVENGDEAIVITISSKLSGTYQSAVQAASSYEGKIFVVDSLNACIGERLLGQLTLKLINEGKSASEIKSILDKQKTKVNVMALLDTLEYLKKGGRISSAVAFAGSLLSIKPVIGVIDGEVKLIGKAMGSKNGMKHLNKLVKNKGGIDFTLPFGIVWSGLDDRVMKKYVADNSNLWAHETNEVPSYLLGGTIGTHVGPGVVGVAFFEK